MSRLGTSRSGAKSFAVSARAPSPRCFLPTDSAQEPFPPHLLVVKLTNSPDEPRQLACDGHGGDNRFLVITVHHPPELAIQSLIRTFGDRNHRCWLPFTPLLDRFARARTMPVMPRRFHQHAS